MNAHILVKVELYPSRKMIDVEINQDDINKIAESKAMEKYLDLIDSCEAIKTTIDLS